MARYPVERTVYDQVSPDGAGGGWRVAVPGHALAVQVITSFMGGRARAAAASARVTTAEVTTEGSNPRVTRSRTAGMAARAWARPVCRVQQREYMASIGRAGSSRYTDGLVHVPSGAVLLSAQRRPSGVPLASTVIGNTPAFLGGGPSMTVAPRAAAMAGRAGWWSR